MEQFDQIDDIKKKVLEDVDPIEKRRKRKEAWKFFWIACAELLVLMILFVFIFYLKMGIATVRGSSMYPTLKKNSRVIYLKNRKHYDPGDIVAFQRPDGENFVKRVIAVEGDTVNIQGGKVYVNGEETVFHSEIGKTFRSDQKTENPCMLQSGEVYVLGDNRENSEDSRHFGPIRVTEIKGRIWYSFGKVR